MKGCKLLHAAHTQETHKHAGNLLKSASGVFVSGSNDSYSDSLFLPGAIQLVRSEGREAARGPSRSESPAALHPKHRLSSPMMMTIFLP